MADGERRNVFRAAALLAVLLPACTLLTSLDGLTGSAAPGELADSSMPGHESGPNDGEASTTLRDADAEPLDGADGADGGGVRPRVYIVGGSNASGSATSQVISAEIQADGGLGAWSFAPSLPGNRRYAWSVLGTDFVAVTGGESSGPTTLSSIAIAPRNGPAVGVWSIVGSMPAPRERHGAALHGSFLYILGGLDRGTANPITFADVQFATITASSLSAFTPTTSLPAARSRIAVATTATNLYVIGGSDSTDTLVSDVLRAPFNADGTLGAFTAEPSLPTPRDHVRALVHGDSLVVTGGELTSGQTNDVIVFPITPTGALGTPRFEAPLPSAVYFHGMVAYDKHLYVLGGYRSGALVHDVAIADLGASGTVSGWMTQTPLPSVWAYHSAFVAF